MSVADWVTQCLENLDSIVQKEAPGSDKRQCAELYLETLRGWSHDVGALAKTPASLISKLAEREDLTNLILHELEALALEIRLCTRAPNRDNRSS